MKLHLRLGAAALILSLAACGQDGGNGSTAAGGGAPVAPVPAPNGGDWTETVATTPEGGFRMGNPDAPVKLVEYASITCPHCADFSSRASEAIKNEYVRSGRVSWEYRSFMLNPFDIAIFMAIGCQGPQPSFKLIEQLYADQPTWVARLQAIPPAEAQRISALPDGERFKATFAATGLAPFFGQRGATQASIDQCLTDKANLDKLVALSERGRSDGVTGTPTFLINGRLAEGAADWNVLRGQLDEALRG